ncbi:uncharacterized protein LOC129732574 isoform X2 [Wyeomyia smithii]|uniref:uncharacterized protein LOC129732574 isoform X2 n=1 Tax=Wyeomyia smithii TaxID=174621 RepID=UPI002467D561|nr:uncharacterized protein LOC129732574 isoform X2 [Wyeomyia smithii]
MSKHNYTNPAFCQQSEFVSGNANNTCAKGAYKSSSRIERNNLTRSYNRISSGIVRQNSFACHGIETSCEKLVPNSKSDRVTEKYASNTSIVGARYGSVSSILDTSISNKQLSGRYALVPVEEIPVTDKSRYTVLPMEHTLTNDSSSRTIRSQDNIDRYSSITELNIEPNNLSDQFCSLPPLTTPPQSLTQNRLKNAFSSDFGSKSFVLFDQKSNQRYEVVRTEDNEELVDPNHEIIQMHNGRAHRYAVIPTDNNETCLTEKIKEDFKQPPTPQRDNVYDTYKKSLCNLTPQRTLSTGETSSPTQQALATQMLHELLSTPRRADITPSNSPQRRDNQPKMVSSTPKRNEFKPQKLQYDRCLQQARAKQQLHQQQQTQYEAAVRTTAVITPRLNVYDNGCYGETITSPELTDKSWQNASFQKIAHASATIGAVSLMLILCGFLNSGLSLYFTSKIGREYYLDLTIFSGFAAIALGILGFKSRQCNWLPNRNYISVTIFSLLNCCAQLILMTLHPFPGTPLHDVTTGIILGLSSLTLLLISLGAVTSRWCRVPPPDNRVAIV